jgi:peptidoglycan/LPS O-acetylase OafA/YrhL
MSWSGHGRGVQGRSGNGMAHVQLHPAYRPDIDGLRAVAVVSVVTFHAFPGAMSGGFTGVDVFFVISGYLISSIILKNLDKGIFSFADFYARRVRRIFPALILVLAASYAFGWFALLPEEYRQFGRHVAAGAGFASNFQLWREAGYFDVEADTKPLLHLWSLGIEEQFYIVWPLLLWLAHKSQWRLLLMTGAGAISFYVCVATTRTDAVAAFFLPHTRFWELLCGSLLAWVTLYRERAVSAVGGHGSAAAGAVSLGGFLLLAFGFFRISRDSSFPGPWAIVPVLGAVLVIAAGPGALLNRAVLSRRAAVWFGLISYPLYLWHWPLLSFARIAGNGTPGVAVRIACVGASVALAWLTCRFVERPVRLGGQGGKSGAAVPAAPALAVPVLAVLMAAAGGVGYATCANDGFGFRQDAMIKGHDVYSYYKYIAEHHYVCTPPELAGEAPRWEGFTRCMQSKAAPDVDIALVGDSHAEHLFPGIAAALPERNVAYYIKSAPAFAGQPEFQNIFSHVIAARSIRHVILTMFWGPILAQVPEGSSLDREVSRVIDALTDAGKTVYLTDDVPYFPFTASECKRYRWLAWKNPNCEISAGAGMQMYGQYISALRKAVEGRPGTRLLETARYVCGSGVCSMVKGNDILYRDAHHLSLAGSLLIGRKIVEDNPGIFD